MSEWQQQADDEIICTRNGRQAVVNKLELQRRSVTAVLYGFSYLAGGTKRRRHTTEASG